MTRIVAVHGVGNYRNSPADLAAADLSGRLTDALISGLTANPRIGTMPAIDLCAAYYAHLLRDPGEQDASDLDRLTPDELEILAAWATSLGLPSVSPQGAATLPLRLICDALARSVGRSHDHSYQRRLTRLLANFVRDTARYLNHATRRDAVRQHIATTISQHQPQIVIAHSLGSVVTYETLHACPELRVDLLITVGSPLALPGAIFDRLHPTPSPNLHHGKGTCPPSVENWVNLADIGDPIAIPRPLHARFHGLRPDDDREISIGFASMHAFAHYLRSAAISHVLTIYSDSS
jgi:hypothetical protein